MIYLLAFSILANITVVALAFYAFGRRERSAQVDRDRLLATIDTLCQRVQAPELAVVDHQARQETLASPPAVGFDNDDEYWQATEMTKEQLAEQMMARELARTDGSAA